MEILNLNILRSALLNSILCFVFLLCSQSLESQIAGRGKYAFLDLPTNPISNATGVNIVSQFSGKDDLVLSNPSLMADGKHSSLQINHMFYYADISVSNALYYHRRDTSALSWGVSASTIDYGDFDLSNIYGDISDQFTARESSIAIHLGKQYRERLKYGGTVKYVHTDLFESGQNSILFDFGVEYRNPSRQTSIGGSIRNLGFGQKSVFVDSLNSETAYLPFSASIGFSKKMKNLPFELFITAQKLEKWNLLSEYDNPTDDDDEFAEPRSPFSAGIQNLFRHLVFSGSLYLGSQERVRLTLGYNYLRSRELQDIEFKSLSGLSFGLGIAAKRFDLSMGSSYYHLAGGFNLQLGLNLKLSNWKRF